MQPQYKQSAKGGSMTNGMSGQKRTWSSISQKWTSGLSFAALCSSVHACVSRLAYATCRMKHSHFADPTTVRATDHEIAAWSFGTTPCSGV